MDKIKIFKINDYEWIAAETMEEAIQCEIDICGVSREEAYDESVAHELSEEEMNTFFFIEDDQSKVPFVDKLNSLIKEGVEFPCYFASTEF
jgi:hypothetical protein